MTLCYVEKEMTDDMDLDPTIAELLAEAAANQPEMPQVAFDENAVEDVTNTFGVPGLSDSRNASVRMPNAKLPSEMGKEEDNPLAKVDFRVTSFTPIEKCYEDESNHIFDDKTYYKTALMGEGEAAQRVHKILSKYLVCQDPKDRTVYRQQIVTAFWELVKNIAPKAVSKSIPNPKRMLLRFGVVLPSLFTPEQKQLFSTVILENNTGEPVYYMDEWFRDIGSGRLTLSATDEARPKKAAGGANQQQLLSLKGKNDGKLQTAENMLTGKESERHALESELRGRIDALCNHFPLPNLDPHTSAYTEAQLKLFGDIQERLRALQRNNKEIVTYLRELEEAKTTANSLNAKMNEQSVTMEVSNADLEVEYNTVRQMAKMTIGRKGNQFPVFTREFYHCIPQLTGFRENVINTLHWIESIDPTAFHRIHKNTPNRIVPYVLLLPTYGDFGFCWEPFDRYNRVTSRGRIVVPMYPRDLKVSLLMAVADLRWQVAKEKASFYWMEEGLTGQYYQWIEEQKLKGDLKSFFIADYVLWMTKEANGTQVMDKKLRAIFWRFVPFAQEKKDDLKKRSMVYAELYQRDLNRAMSDGY